MGNNVIRYTLDFAANTQNVENQLTRLKTSLQTVMSGFGSGVGTQLNNDLNQASIAASKLGIHLKNAINTDTGQLNLLKLQTSMKKTGDSAAVLSAQILSGGTAGKQAFMDLATYIAAAQKPTMTLNKHMQALWTTMKNTMKWQLSSFALTGFISSITNAINFTKELNKNLNDIRIVTGESSKSMEKFAKDANKVAKSIGTTTTEFTKATLIYRQQGDTAEAAMKKAEITTKAANVAFDINSQEMSEYLTAIWNSYQVGSKELELFVDKLAKVGAETATDMGELATAMEKVAATANTVGVTYDQLLATIATVSSATRQSAESVGTAFKTIYARLGDLKIDGSAIDEDGIKISLGQVSSQLKTIGIDVLNTNGDMRDMGLVVEDIGNKWQTMTSAEKAAVAQAIAGKRQYTQVMALFENWDEYKETLDDAANAQGELNKQNQIYLDSWAGASAQLKNTAQGLTMKILDDDVIIDVINALNGILEFIDYLGESIGGFGPIILSITGILLNQFAPQIASAFGNVGTGILSIMGFGDQLANKARSEWQQIIKESFKIPGITTDEQKRLTYIEELISASQTYADIYKNMPKHVQQANQQVFDMIKNNNDKAINNQQTVVKQKTDSYDTALNKASMSGTSFFDTHQNMDAQTRIQAISGSGISATQLMGSGEDNQAIYADIKVKLQKYGLALEDNSISLRGLLDNLNNQELSTNDYNSALKQISTLFSMSDDDIATLAQESKEVSLAQNEFEKVILEAKNKVADFMNNLTNGQYNPSRFAEVQNNKTTSVNNIDSVNESELINTRTFAYGEEKNPNSSRSILKNAATSMGFEGTNTSLEALPKQELLTTLNAEMEKINNSTEEGKQKLAQYQKLIEKVNNAGSATTKGLNKNKKVFDQLYGQKGQKEIKKTDKTYSGIKKEIKSVTSNLEKTKKTTDDVNKKTKKTGEGFEEGTKKSKTFSNSMDGLIKNVDNFANKTNKAKTSFIDFLDKGKNKLPGVGQGLVSMAGGFMSLAGTINSIRGTWDTLTDPDTSGWERLTSVLMTLGMTMMSLNSIWQGFGSLMTVAVTIVGAFTKAKQKENVEIMEGNKLKTEEVAVTGANIGAETAETLATTTGTAADKKDNIESKKTVGQKFIEAMSHLGVASAKAASQTGSQNYAGAAATVAAIVAAIALIGSGVAFAMNAGGSKSTSEKSSEELSKNKEELSEIKEERESIKTRLDEIDDEIKKSKKDGDNEKVQELINEKSRLEVRDNTLEQRETRTKQTVHNNAVSVLSAEYEGSDNIEDYLNDKIYGLSGQKRIDWINKNYYQGEDGEPGIEQKIVEAMDSLDLSTSEGKELYKKYENALLYMEKYMNEAEDEVDVEARGKEKLEAAYELEGAGGDFSIWLAGIGADTTYEKWGEAEAKAELANSKMLSIDMSKAESYTYSNNGEEYIGFKNLSDDVYKQLESYVWNKGQEAYNEVLSNGGNLTDASEAKKLAIEEARVDAHKQIAAEIVKQKHEEAQKNGILGQGKKELEEQKELLEDQSEEIEEQVDMISDISNNYSSLSDAYDDIAEDGQISSNSLSNLYSEFSDVKNIDDYIVALGQANITTEEAGNIFKTLIDEKMKAKMLDANLTEASKTIMAQQLVEYGMVNNLDDAYEYLNHLKTEALVANAGLSSTIDPLVQKLEDEGWASEHAGESLFDLTEDMLNAIDVANVQESFGITQNLLSMAIAAGATAEIIQPLITLMRLLDQAAQGDHSEDYLIDDYVLYIQNKLKTLNVTVKTNPVVRSPRSPSGKSKSNDDLYEGLDDTEIKISDSRKKYIESVENEIDDLSHLKDMLDTDLNNYDDVISTQKQIIEKDKQLINGLKIHLNYLNNNLLKNAIANSGYSEEEIKSWFNDDGSETQIYADYVNKHFIGKSNDNIKKFEESLEPVKKIIEEIYKTTEQIDEATVTFDEDMRELIDITKEKINDLISDSESLNELYEEGTGLLSYKTKIKIEQNLINTIGEYISYLKSLGYTIETSAALRDAYQKKFTIIYSAFEDQISHYESLSNLLNKDFQFIDYDKIRTLTLSAIEVINAEISYLESLGYTIETSSKLQELYQNKFDKESELIESYDSQFEQYIEEIQAYYDEYEHRLNNQIEYNEYLISQQESLISLKESYNELENELLDMQYEAEQNYISSRQNIQWLDAATRKILYNEEDYYKEISKIAEVQEYISDLQIKYQKEINNLKEDEIYKAEFLTQEYEAQLEAKREELNILKASLDIDNKRNALNTALMEKNVRVYVGGRWRQIANTEDVNSAYQDYMESVYESEKAIRENEQNEEIRYLDEQKRLREEENAMWEAYLENMQKQIEDLEYEYQFLTSKVNLTGDLVGKFNSAINNAYNNLDDLANERQSIVEGNYDPTEMGGELYNLTPEEISALNAIVWSKGQLEIIDKREKEEGVLFPGWRTVETQAIEDNIGKLPPIIANLIRNMSYAEASEFLEKFVKKTVVDKKTNPEYLTRIILEDKKEWDRLEKERLKAVENGQLEQAAILEKEQKEIAEGAQQHYKDLKDINKELADYLSKYSYESLQSIQTNSGKVVQTISDMAKDIVKQYLSSDEIEEKYDYEEENSKESKENYQEYKFESYNGTGSYAVLPDGTKVSVNVVDGHTQTPNLPVGTVVYPSGANGQGWEITGGEGGDYNSKPSTNGGSSSKPSTNGGSSSNSNSVNNNTSSNSSSNNNNNSNGNSNSKYDSLSGNTPVYTDKGTMTKDQAVANGATILGPFAKGTKDAPGKGIAQVNELGMELLATNDGQFIELNPHEKIFNNEQMNFLYDFSQKGINDMEKIKKSVSSINIETTHIENITLELPNVTDTDSFIDGLNNLTDYIKNMPK